MKHSPIPNLPTKLFLGGEWRDASDGVTFAVDNPATGEIIANVASATVDDGMAALDAAEKAFPDWAALKPRERGEILRKAFELIMAQKEELARLITMENGKALTDSRGEIAYAAEFFRWSSEEAVRAIGELYRGPSSGARIVVHHKPTGIGVLVTPWNFPAAMATRKIGPALAAGCPVILKPASDTPLTALLMARILADAGVPDGVVSVLPSRSSGAVVSAMLHDPRVRKLSFTGSTEVGRVLLREAADQVVNCSMELGGNAPFLVFDDADLDAAVEGAMVAKMRHSAETCTAANRFLVQRGVAAEFTERLADAMRAVRVGNGFDPGVTCGPMINRKEQQRVAELVGQSVDAGAEVVVGGKVVDGPGYFFQPTVLSGLDPSSPISHEEIFGPVAPIVTFDDAATAVRLANDTEMGLTAYVYTSDLRQGLAVSEQIQAGMVGLNRGTVSDPAAPFGGMKQSGLGREGASEGIYEFCETQYIATTW